MRRRDRRRRREEGIDDRILADEASIAGTMRVPPPMPVIPECDLCDNGRDLVPGEGCERCPRFRPDASRPRRYA